MARTRPRRISRPAIVGLVFLGIVVLVIIGAYLGVRFGAGGKTYRIAARFTTVSGLAPGAAVYFSGTKAGTVTRIQLLPDNSVDVIMRIASSTSIPKDSKFSIQTSFTGSPNVAIMPPKHPTATLPRRVLPISEQPVGTVPLSIDQLMAEGKTVGGRAQRALQMARSRSGVMMGALGHSRENAGATMTEVKGVMPRAMAQMQGTIAQARANVAQAQRVLPTRDHAKIAAAAASLKASSAALNASATSLKSISRDPRARGNLHAMAANIKTATENMQSAVNAFKGVTGNAQTRAALRDASANLHAILAKLKSLL